MRILFVYFIHYCTFDFSKVFVYFHILKIVLLLIVSQLFLVLPD